MTDEKNIDEYIERYENPHRIIISTEEFGNMLQEFYEEFEEETNEST